MSTAVASTMSLAEFLEWEARQPQRYEFDRGVVRAMAGGTQAHDQVRLAVAASLLGKLRGKPCRPHLDVRLSCPNGNVRYPDVAVNCAPFAPLSPELTTPVLIVEVLSPSTQATDYITKTEDYSSFESIEVYWLISPDAPRIDVLRRIDGKLKFSETLEGIDSRIVFEPLGIDLAFSEIYETN